MFTDIHTHHRQSAGGASIYNLTPGEEPCEGFFSAGVHPWLADQFTPASAISYLKSTHKYPQFVAVGEIGIDRACAVPIAQQASLFECQMIWAAEHNIPCIIHCVRAYSDILQVLKRHKFIPTVIFHAYSGNKQTTVQLSHFGAYFSLGMRELMRTNYLQEIPTDKLFLETDVQKSEISSVYDLASKQLDMPIDELCRIVAQNVKHVWTEGWSFRQ